MTRYRLWKAAQAICPKLPQSAVYEFLRGQRDIGVQYAEALTRAAGLRLAPIGPVKAVRPRASQVRPKGPRRVDRRRLGLSSSLAPLVTGKKSGK